MKKIKSKLNAKKFSEGNFLNINKLLTVFIYLLIAYAIFSVFFVFISRLFFPYQLEWMEGGEIEHILRLLDGKCIYCPPSLEFIPYIYTPLFYYIGIPFIRIFGVNFFSIRLVSILGFVLLLSTTYLVVFKTTKNKFWSFVAVGLLAFSYSTTGFWFDLARVDTIANLFMLLSFFFLLDENPKRNLLSAFFAFCAFYTKQSFISVHLFLLLGLLIRNKGLFSKHFLLYFSLILVSTIIETIRSDGWYIFWNFTLPASHYWIWSRVVTFWSIDLLPFYSISLALILGYFFVQKDELLKSKEIYFLLFLIGTLFNSYFLRLHYGGYLNVLIPFVISISIVLPIIVFRFQQMFNSKNIQTILLTLVLVQFCLLIYDFRTPIPTQKDKAEIEYLLNNFKETPGDVYLMGYNFVQRYIGKRDFPHYVLVNDLLIANVKEKESFEREFIDSLKTHKFSAILLDDDLTLKHLDKYYYKTDKFFYHRVFNTKNVFRKEVVWLPKQKDYSN